MRGRTEKCKKGRWVYREEGAFELVSFECSIVNYIVSLHHDYKITRKLQRPDKMRSGERAVASGVRILLPLLRFSLSGFALESENRGLYGRELLVGT